MLLPGLIALIIMPLIMYWMYPPEVKETPNAAQFAKTKLKEMGPVSKNEIIMLGVFGILLLLWAGIPAMIFGSAWAVDPTTTAFIGLGLLLITGVLTWEDILTQKSAWDTITWFAALVMMATYLNKLGLITWFSGVLETGIGHLGLELDACLFIIDARLLVCTLYVCQYHSTYYCHVCSILYGWTGTMGAPPMLFALMMASSVKHHDDLNPLCNGYIACGIGSGYTLGEWWKAGCHECRQYHHLCGDWRTLVESVGLLVIKYEEHSVRIEMFL
jgi:DASS family divalent anion:Na+ symporter